MRPPTILMSSAALDTIGAEAPTSANGNETGGILLGHDHGTEIAVHVAGLPGEAAVRTPTTFARDLRYAQTLADTAYDDDGSIWLGEWHTHPKGPPMPSAVDLQTYLTLLRDDRLDFQRVLSIVVTPCDDHGWAHPHLQAFLVEEEQHTATDSVLVSRCELGRKNNA